MKGHIEVAEFSFGELDDLEVCRILSFLRALFLGYHSSKVSRNSILTSIVFADSSEA